MADGLPAQAPLFAVKCTASAQSIDVIGGQIPLVIDTVAATRAHFAAGKLKPLAITSLKSSELPPGVKSVAEKGIAGFEVVAWNAVFAPRGTPPAVVQKMSEHIHRALQQQAEARQRPMDIGVEPLFMDAKQPDRFMRDERPKWGGVIKAAGVRVD